ncbi:hypothetical protein [Cytobacillus luteolus]|uniref:hypothetical protein n=1 Tax=Litchfieldia luteola TaxID=682179 RepID=UPI0018755F69|nr:hypothetical protein [Cytobacillus luteolus]MBP1943434.1 hypothetical protein [Cytobacillus luteolus]
MYGGTSRLDLIQRIYIDNNFAKIIVPGRTSGKTIQMSDRLQDMAVEFCNVKNIKQRVLKLHKEVLQEIWL